MFRAWSGSTAGSWAGLMGEREARSMVGVTMKRLGVEGPLSRFRVEHHLKNGDLKIWVWGENEAGYQEEEEPHVGTLVEVDGRRIFNNLEPLDKSDPHDDCPLCA